MKTDVYVIDVRAMHALLLPFFVLTWEDYKRESKNGEIDRRELISYVNIYNL